VHCHGLGSGHPAREEQDGHQEASPTDAMLYPGTPHQGQRKYRKSEKRQGKFLARFRLSPPGICGKLTPDLPLGHDPTALQWRRTSDRIEIISGSAGANMAEEFSLVHQVDGPVLIIRTKGYLNDLGAEQVDTICSDSLGKGIKKIVINLEQSPLINSIGISILIGVIEAIEEAGGALAFTNLTPTNRKTFEMMGLLQFAQAFDAEADAVKAYKA
jgi:anti-anti-sigma factor